MLKQLVSSSRQLIASSRLQNSSLKSRGASSLTNSRTEESEADEDAPTEQSSQGAEVTKKTKPPSARRLAYESPPRDLLFGIHPVEIALAEKRRKFYKLFLKPDRYAPLNDNLKNIADWATKLEIPIVFKRIEELSYLTKDRLHQGVVLSASRLKHKSWTEQMEIFGKSDEEGRLLVYLDRIMDPMNMGAVIRTCVFLGVDAILIPPEKSCKLSTTVSKASSGALECATIATVEQPYEFMSFVKKLDWEILGTDSDCLPYDEYEPSPRNRLLVLGNEGHGVNEELVNFFTTTVSVPGVTNRVGSLNVSVTAGVLLTHFAKHKRNT